MKSKMIKVMVTALALTSFGLMGCEPDKDAEGPVNITVKDADGNKYPTMKIGQQIWMAKNLNVNVPGSVCYNNDPANCEKYGRLYTWEAAKNACPSGWHLPSVEEIKNFAAAINARTEQIVAQKKLNAETLRNGEDKFYNHLRDSSWNDGFDTFGFSALPAGRYTSENSKPFDELGEYAFFWSSTVAERGFDRGQVGHFWIKSSRNLFFGGDGFRGENTFRTFGLSVRCLRD